MFNEEKTDWCKNNPEKLSTTKVYKYFPSGFSIYKTPFKSIKISMVYTEIKIA